MYVTNRKEAVEGRKNKKFNAQFRDKVSVLYSSMVEVDKRNLFATTPLRTCVKSSVKQPLPSEVSIDDCLLKGLSALADLYTMKLGMKEHRV